MAPKLLIRDGNPNWWSSPDIWVVPGADPNGPPGDPIAGKPAYVWAHVANTGQSAADGTRIDFFWANPSLGVLRSTSTPIGSAFADIPAGGAQDVLCLVPWKPVVVNNGHECVVAVAVHPEDPLPNPPPDDFNPPAYDQVAQRNMTVLAMAAAKMLAPIPLTLAATDRVDKRVRVSVTLGGELDQATRARIGLVDYSPAKGAFVAVGLGLEPVCDGGLSHEPLDITIPRGTSTAVYVTLRSADVGPHQYGLVNVVEQDGRQIIGGYTFIVVSHLTGARK